jgi:Flp pilus assembly protein TadG
MASWTVTVRLRKALRAVRLPRARREDGQVIPMVAIMMVVIIGIAAFAIDLSSWWSDQRHLQMQADAAVLAGANEFVKGLGDCASNASQVKATAYHYADSTEAGGSGIASNGEAGTVTANVQVACATAQGSYVDATLTNSNPASFFSGIFGIKPKISVHSRASLVQVTEEGGSQVLPYAIGQSQAVYNNQLVTIPVNKGSAIQGLICDGTSASTDQEMVNLELNGCPLTQVNQGGDTCPSTQLSPPSCLWNFTGVDETNGYDAGEVPRFDSGLTKHSPALKCTVPYPEPANNYPQYLANGTIVGGDPRVITLFVVPDGSFSKSSHLTPIVGYAEFYVTGWDHDPCANKVAGVAGVNGVDSHPGGGSLSGYFISYTNPESQNVQGSGPCDPNPQYAYTYNCTYALTQ